MTPEDRLKKYGFSSPDEMAYDRQSKEVVCDPPYPKPIHRFRFTLEQQGLDIEEIYYWIHTALVDDFGFAKRHKIKDIFTGSEMSSFFGQQQQRLQIQQNQVSNYLATIGKLIKELFQLVRELRIMKERISYYEESNKEIRDKVQDAKKSCSPEIVLRGTWVDLMDGGAKSPGSVYGLASNLGYATLPDLFFHAPPMRKEQVDVYVDSLDFNTRVKDVLKRKLYAFIAWKEQTYSELTQRNKFTLKYLRQHYNAVQMYINWIKPYLANVRRLSPNYKLPDENTDMISAFEGAVLEIEYLATQPKGKLSNGKNINACVMVSMYYRSRPQLEYADKSYQNRGPQHTGKVTCVLRQYAWTDEEIEQYKKMRQEELFDELLHIDRSLKEAMEGLGQDLYSLLEEAGEHMKEEDRGVEKIAEGLLATKMAKTLDEARKKAQEMKKAEDEKKKNPPKPPGMLEPFSELLNGIFFFLPEKSKDKKSEVPQWKANAKDAGLKKGAAKSAEVAMWQTYKNFKASHGMVKW